MKIFSIYLQKSAVDLLFTFWSIIHLGLVFVCDVRQESNFIFKVWIINDLYSINWTKLSFPYNSVIFPSVLYKEFKYAGSVTKLSILFLWSICLYLHIYYITLIIIMLQKVLISETTGLPTILLFKARLQSI